MASAYPTGLDSFNTSHIAGETIVAATDNDQADAINKIEAELGTTPSGIHTNVSDRLAVISEAPLNVQNPPVGSPALADGSDDQAEIQAMLNLANFASPKGAVYIPRGEYTIGSGLSIGGTGVSMFGDGPESTVLKKGAADFNLVTVGGPNAAGHTRYNQVHDLKLHGNDRTGKLMVMAYCNNSTLRNIQFWGNNDSAIDTCEWWDSLIDNCWFEWCSGGDGTKPMLYLRSSFAGSGFGSSVDSTNMIRVSNCRFESWRDGAVWVDNGPTGFGGNGFWFDNNKIESYEIRGVGMKIGGTINDIHWDRGYIYMGAFNSGFSTAQMAVDWSPAGRSSFKNTLIANGGVATVASGAHFWGSGKPVVEAITSGYGTAPTVGHLVHGGGPRPIVRDCATEVATVASATTLPYPLGVKWLNVTGGTNVTTIPIANAGETVTLKASAGFTLVHGSGNLVNPGATNIVLAANDSISYTSDGTNWY